MIEKMLKEIKKYLPLKISEALWDGTVFQIYDSIWNFTTLSAWRISTKNNVVFGCFDKDSIQLISNIKNLKILDISFQSDLKIDPIFLLSNGQRIEIFSTDTFEPWTFQLDELGAFVATPADPDSFNL